jgi:hypothetical protein
MNQNKELIAKLMAVVFESPIHPRHAAYVMELAARKLRHPDYIRLYELGVPPGVPDDLTLAWLCGELTTEEAVKAGKT